MSEPAGSGWCVVTCPLHFWRYGGLILYGVMVVVRPEPLPTVA